MQDGYMQGIVALLENEKDYLNFEITGKRHAVPHSNTDCSQHLVEPVSSLNPLAQTKQLGKDFHGCSMVVARSI